MVLVLLVGIVLVALALAALTVFADPPRPSKDPLRALGLDLFEEVAAGVYVVVPFALFLLNMILVGLLVKGSPTPVLLWGCLLWLALMLASLWLWWQGVRLLGEWFTCSKGGGVPRRKK